MNTAAAKAGRQLGVAYRVHLDPFNLEIRRTMREGAIGAPDVLIDTSDSKRQFAAQIDGFSLAARANVPHRTPGSMGQRDIALIEAIYRSADAGGIVVRI